MSLSKLLETSIAKPLEGIVQQNHKLFNQMDMRIRASTVEMMKPLTATAESNRLLNQKVSSATAKAFEGITQQNRKLFEPMNIKINSSMAEMMKPLTAVAKSNILPSIKMSTGTAKAL